eukprot:Skav211921  [mRNA]  locus=scaffold1086:44912:50323:+ [translate_table: standard]
MASQVSKEGQGMNLKSGYVVAPEDNGRLGVVVQPGLQQNRAELTCRQDRQLLLQLLALRGLRLLMPGLKQLVPAPPCCKEDLGLILLVSSYVSEAPQCLHHFGGFMRRVWMENWSPGMTSALDAACCDIGLGRVLFAGTGRGCSKHPGLCGPDDFFNSVELYDCLTDTWQSLPPMATRRHGATASRHHTTGCHAAALDPLRGL